MMAHRAAELAGSAVLTDAFKRSAATGHADYAGSGSAARGGALYRSHTIISDIKRRGLRLVMLK